MRSWSYSARVLRASWLCLSYRLAQRHAQKKFSCQTVGGGTTCQYSVKGVSASWTPALLCGSGERERSTSSTKPSSPNPGKISFKDENDNLTKVTDKDGYSFGQWSNPVTGDVVSSTKHNEETFLFAHTGRFHLRYGHAYGREHLPNPDGLNSCFKPWAGRCSTSTRAADLEPRPQRVRRRLLRGRPFTPSSPDLRGGWPRGSPFARWDQRRGKRLSLPQRARCRRGHRSRDRSQLRGGHSGTLAGERPTAR